MDITLKTEPVEKIRQAEVQIPYQKLLVEFTTVAELRGAIKTEIDRMFEKDELGLIVDEI
ncbi:MAG: hypothetical protein DBP02_15045 [gamma proteobacterium symbiont of Ctena orbiculata]|nr:MAG: hypothetical protein DBP02_15045 [gamma proteobacterium symbiont of Ctena orbiculata]